MYMILAKTAACLQEPFSRAPQKGRIEKLSDKDNSRTLTEIIHNATVSGDYGCQYIVKIHKMQNGKYWNLTTSLSSTLSPAVGYTQAPMLS